MSPGVNEGSATAPRTRRRRPGGRRSRAAEVPSEDAAASSTSSPDELSLARAQLAAGLPAWPREPLRRRIAMLEADGTSGDEELDALARPAGRGALAAGPARRRTRRARRDAAVERRSGACPIVHAHRGRGARRVRRARPRRRRAGARHRGGRRGRGVRAARRRPGSRSPGRCRASSCPQPARRAAAAWSQAADEPDADAGRRRTRGRRPRACGSRRHASPTWPATSSAATARCRSPCGWIAGSPADGVAIMEPTLGGQPHAERLLLYGDLLRAAGRRVEADRAYDRAADRAELILHPRSTRSLTPPCSARSSSPSPMPSSADSSARSSAASSARASRSSAFAC